MSTAGKTPLYWRALRLKHLRPNGWQRAVLVEGVLAVAVTLVLADVASAWTLVALPLASVIVVKAHDLLTGYLRPAGRTDAEPKPETETEAETGTTPSPAGQRRRADVWWT